jgi:16S rRNA (cytosine967-C5)-methyltransferase
MTSRQAAVMALFEVENSGAYSDKALKKILGEGNMPPAEKALASELTYGVIRHKMRIDFIIQAYSTQKLKRLSLWILCILRVGIYQIFFS